MSSVQNKIMSPSTESDPKQETEGQREPKKATTKGRVGEVEG